MGKALQQNQTSSTMQEISINYKEFEKFVNEANVKANLILKKNDPSRFNFKYGKNANEKSLIKQT